MNITNDLVTEYIRGYYRPVNEELASLREIGEKDMVPIILKETEMLLKTILYLKKPVKILEIGTAIGYSSVFFATVCENAEVFTIEKDEYAWIAAKSNIEKLGLSERIHLYLGDGQEQIEKMRDNGINNFDFVFIDAAKSHYRRFFDAAETVCAEDALIVSDNILQRAMTVSDVYDTKDKHRTNIRKMREYVSFICNDSALETSVMSIGDGLAITVLKNGRK